MCNDARSRLKWKVELLSYLNVFSPLVKKPVMKLVHEMVYGILSSGSLKLSDIARSLKEKTHLHHTSKRLSRMLIKHKLWMTIEEMVLSRMSRHVLDDMVLAIDPGDLDRRFSKQCECIGKIRDGSTGDIISGYPLMSVVARGGKNRLTIPLFLRAYSHEEYGCNSENNAIISAMSHVRQKVGDKLWVIDRGGDRGELWKHWLNNEYQMLVRVTKQRHWSWRNEFLNAQSIAKKLPCKHTCLLRKHGSKTVKFGITTVRLRSHPNTPLSMIVVRHGKKEPMVLVSTRHIRGRRQGMALIQAYMDRWAVEEGFRFSKQGFDLEGVMARKLNVIKNLVAFTLLAWSFLVEHEQAADDLKELGKHDRLKDSISKKKPNQERKRVVFPFYAILKGWKMLFALAKTALTKFIRNPNKPKPDKQLSLAGFSSQGVFL